MQKTYLFYDTETSGLNKAFDQVLQFAAIRTDLALNEIERHEILIKLNPDIIPSPHALLTHGISITQATHGMCEFEAMQQIHKMMNTPGTISLGYNTLGFDDEFLRFSFYRNLLPPYTHQYANECSRMDLYPMAIMYYLYKPDIICWPSNNEQNKISFKLEQLNLCNHLFPGTAHNAMVDVEVTLALAKRFMQDQKMWHYLSNFFDKSYDLTQTAKLPFTFKTTLSEHQECLLIDPGFGTALNYQCPVISLGSHNYYKNQTLWLRLDRPELSETTAENIAKTTWMIAKKYGEPHFLLPNNPRFNKNINNTEHQKIVENNKTWLQQNPELLQTIANYYRNYTYEKIPNLDLDAALYQNGFLNPVETNFCQEFHQATLTQKIQLLDLLGDNTYLQQQAVRILARNYPAALPERYQTEFNHYLENLMIADAEKVFKDYRGKPRFTAMMALAEITEIKATKTLDQRQAQILQELENYLRIRNSGY